MQPLGNGTQWTRGSRDVFVRVREGRSELAGWIRGIPRRSRVIHETDSGLSALAGIARQWLGLVHFGTGPVPHGCGGPGRPGEDVFLKAGATPLEPLTTIGSDGGRVVLVNVDQGVQANSGRNAVVLGTIENSVPCEFVDGLMILRWELKTFRSTPHALSVQADDQGRVWLIVGTDSGFEAQTAIYYTRVSVTFSPQ
jgi:hypothetical protein